LGALKHPQRNLNATLRTSDLTIIPAPCGLARLLAEPRHSLGTLMTVLFLSLGAPFWYNVLRQLSNLRPPWRRKIEPKSLTGH